jgi:alpha,alpha-trehalase
MILTRIRALATFLLFVSTTALTQSPSAPSPSDQAQIHTYIANSWDTLSRSMSECQVDVRHLPHMINHLGDVRPSELPVPGLLYLPNRYVVPGGRFNEMYGWDSYFILLGLEHDGRRDLARGMVENFFYEIENYGAVLNANRTYYFTRSQPPFLSSMIREVYEHPPAGTHPDKQWLARAYKYAQRDYALWTSAQHQAGKTSLARYSDLGDGPVPEMADDSSYYPDVIRWLLAHPNDHPEYLVNGSANQTPAEATTLTKISCDASASRVCASAVVDGHRLSANFYHGDRAMRESGFDTTFRFGPFSGSASDYAPVCLNSLLFKYEQDMAHFATLLGRKTEASTWTQQATARHAAIDKYLWDADAGLYEDYNFVTQTRSTYHFLTTFYPLWADLATPAQAAGVRAHLSVFEQTGGLQTSDVNSGVQWDAPFGWAPITWFAVSGLDRSGFHGDAARIAQKFTTTILDNFLRDGTIREKYNVASGSANVSVAAGYKANVAGFGWTNAVYLELDDMLHSPANPR